MSASEREQERRAVELAERMLADQATRGTLTQGRLTERAELALRDAEGIVAAVAAAAARSRRGVK